jgi:hypothetical protein
VRTKPTQASATPTDRCGQHFTVFAGGSPFSLAGVSVAGELPQIEDILRLTLRRRVPLPDVAPDGGAQPVTIGGEARPLSPASINTLRWLFALLGGLTPRHRQDSIQAAVRELLQFGFLVVNRDH